MQFHECMLVGSCIHALAICLDACIPVSRARMHARTWIENPFNHMNLCEAGLRVLYFRVLMSYMYLRKSNIRAPCASMPACQAFSHMKHEFIVAWR